MPRASLSFVVASVLGPSFAQEAPPPQNPAPVQAPATGFLPRTITIDGVERRYVVYVPPGYTQERDWPLVMFLHGMGECGTDGKRQVEVGLGPAIKADPQRWPFVVVMPQKPDKPSQWSDHEALVMGTLEAAEAEFRIDPQRRFLTGLSQGGAGTWALGSKHASVWAAIAPVCGYKTPVFDAAALKATPTWAFHGLDDKVVPASQSKELCASVKAAGGDPMLTEYANTAHNSWDQAYGDSNLAEWFRVQRSDALFAAALQGRVSSPCRGLRLELATADEIESLTLSSDDKGWKWRSVRLRRADFEAIGTPIETVVPSAAAVACLCDCVRELTRAGVIEAPRDSGEIPQQAYVRFDVGLGYGGRSAGSPKYWPVRDGAEPAVAAIQRAAAAIKSQR